VQQAFETVRMVGECCKDSTKNVGNTPESKQQIRKVFYTFFIRTIL